MSTEGLGERPSPEAAAAEQAGLPLATLLSMCDRLLGEIGRRRHLFAWLRSPDAGSEEWLPVDAYYPGNRLVVVSRETAAEHGRLYAELVPAHGLKLLSIDPPELGGDPSEAMQALERMIEGLELPKRHTEAPPAPPRENPVTQALASLVPPPPPAPARPRRPSPSHTEAAQRAARFVDAHKSELARPPAVGHQPPRLRPVSRRPSGRRRRHFRELDALGVVSGVALAAVLCGEIYVAVARAWLIGGRALLGVGLLLDALSRLLGTIAAGRTGSREWSWGCLLIGSPAVAIFALFQRSGPVSVKPAPLAGLIALPAIALIAIGVVV